MKHVSAREPKQQAESAQHQSDQVSLAKRRRAAQDAASKGGMRAGGPPYHPGNQVMLNLTSGCVAAK